MTYEEAIEEIKYAMFYELSPENLLANLLTPSQIAAWKAGGILVVTDTDQSLPHNPYIDTGNEGGLSTYGLAQTVMINDNFRRVVG